MLSKTHRLVLQKAGLLTTGPFWYERSDTADMASSLCPAVGPERSDTASSSNGSSNGECSMRCVRDDSGGGIVARKLLCRDEFEKLGGATLRGRYGGGGSVKLS
jgi:hypothetical protein